jgi:DNA-binding NarL/FixJ family response regulator
MIPHILIIDADPNAAQITRALVARVAPNAAMRIAPTAQHGRTYLDQRPLDMVIIDPSWNMRADTQLIEYVRQAQPEVYLLALPSVSTPGLRKRMASLGVNAYVEKAAAPPQLLNALRHAIDERTLRAPSRCDDAHPVAH